MNKTFSSIPRPCGGSLLPRCCASLLMICLLAIAHLPATTAAAASETAVAPPVLDLLEAPAQPSERAARSLLMDIAAVNDRLVAVGERGHILVSSDAGNRWQQVQSPVQVSLTAVCFPTPTDGWAVGHDGVVLHTDNGGDSWRKQIDGRAINTLMLRNLEALIEDAENRLATAGEAQRPALAMRLENLEFFLDDLNLAVEEGPTRPLMDVWFNNPREGLVVGAFGIILKTADGGRTWTPLLDRVDNPDGFHYYGICRSGDALYLAGEAGMLFRSKDWGENWTRLDSPYEGSFFGIAGNADESVVAAFGLRASLFVSRDRGDTWARVRVPTGASISGGQFLSDGTLVLTCVDGTILASRDDGRTFTALAQRIPGSIALAQATDGSLVVAGLRGATRLNQRD